MRVKGYLPPVNIAFKDLINLIKRPVLADFFAALKNVRSAGDGMVRTQGLNGAEIQLGRTSTRRYNRGSTRPESPTILSAWIRASESEPSGPLLAPERPGRLYAFSPF